MKAGRYAQTKAKLIDSIAHGAGCELFLVEGDSAASSVAHVRDERTQAILPLQGKPLNAWHADAAKVRGNPLYRQLADALGIDDPTLQSALHVPAPMFTLTHAATGDTVQAYSPAHRDALLAKMHSDAAGEVLQHRHVGLGSLPPALLRRCCIKPATRTARRAGREDFEAVRAAFGLQPNP